METRASYVLIGAFTLAALALALLFALWIGKATLDREFDEYDIVFTEAVTGVTVGGVVQYNGIQIGEVRKLSLDPKDPRRVIAHVRVAAGTPIKVDTHAKLALTGLTGVMIIQLTGGTPAAPGLVAGENQVWPTIIADDSALQKLLSSSEDIATGVNRLLIRVSDLLRQDNLDKVDAMLTHFETVSSRIAQKSEGLGQTLDDLAAASAALRVALARSDGLLIKLDRVAMRTDKLLEKDASEMMASTRIAAESLGDAGKQLRSLLEANREALNQFAGEGMTEVGPALADLRTVMQRLQRVLENLDRDPSGYLLGREQLREVNAP